MRKEIRFTLNGEQVALDTTGDRRLLWVLRTEMGLTGAKYGCGQGRCGSCTVLVDGQAVRSCSFTIARTAGKSVTTIEGLAEGGKLHPLQKAFVDHGGLQCGFCTPGMILSAYGLLLSKPLPSEAEIVQGLEQNLCRCGAHVRIVRAVRTAAEVMAETSNEGGRPR